MKRTIRHFAVLTCFLLTLSAQGGNRWWDGGTVNIAGNGNSASAGGSGNWNTTIQNWDAGAVAHVAWTGNDQAIFGGTAGTVTLVATVPAQINTMTFDTAGYIITGNNLNLAGATPSITANQNTTVNSVMAGTTGLTIAGAGVLTLGGNSTATGTLTISSGATVAVGTINLSSAAGPLTQCATVSLGGTLRYTGATATSARVLSIPAGGTATIEVNSAAVLTLTGVIPATTGGLTKTGTGTLTLNPATSELYTGTTTVSAGELVIGAAGKTDMLSGSSAVNVNGGVLNIFNSEAVGAVTLTSGTIKGGALTGTSFNLQAGSVTAPLAGAVNLTKTTAGTVTITSANTYTGTTAIQQGTVIFSLYTANNANGAFGNASTAVALGSGANAVTLRYTGTGDTRNRKFDFAGTTGTITFEAEGTGAFAETAANTTTGVGVKTIILRGSVSSTLDNQIATIVDSSSGATSVTKDGPCGWALTAANTYSGDTRIIDGILRAGPNVLALQNSTLDMATGDAGTLRFHSSTVAMTVGGLKGSRNITLENEGSSAAVTLTIGSTGNPANTSYSGALTGAGALTKAGSGTLTLSGPNSYNGNTLVTVGAIRVSNNTALGNTTGTTSVSSGAAVEVSGSGLVIAEPLSLIASGISSGGALRNISGDNEWSADIDHGTGAGTGQTGSIRSDSGTLTLSGEWKCTGRAQFDLTLGGAGNITIASTGGLHYNLNQANTGSGAELIKSGGGTLTLNADCWVRSGITFSGGSMVIGLDNPFSCTGSKPTLTMSSSAQLNMADFDVTVNGITGGTGNQINTGSGAGGTLTFGAGGAEGDATTTYSGTIYGTGSLIKNGAGQQTFGNGANLQLYYDGSTTINNGTWLLAGTHGVPNASPGRDIIVNSPGILSLATYSPSLQNLSGNGTVTLGGGTLTINAPSGETFSGGIGGTGNLIKNAGNWTLSGANGYVGTTTCNTSGTLTLSGTLTATTTVNISGGTLLLSGSGERINDAAAVSVTGVLDLGGFSETVGTLAGAGTVTSGAAGSVTLALGGDSPTTTFSGVVQDGSGTVALTKSGTSTLTLSGASANTHTGLTTATVGRLRFGKTSGVNAFGGDLLINGAIVDYNGAVDNQIPDSSDVTLSSGTLDIGTRAETIGNFGGSSGSFTMTGGSLSKGSDTGGDLVLDRNPSISGGTVALSATTAAINVMRELAFNGGTIDFTSSGGGGARLKLMGGDGTGLTYSTGTTTATISSTGGGTANGVTLNDGGTTVFTIANTAADPELLISAKLHGVADALEKAGAGKLVLSGANAYTGDTTVSGGTLLVNGSLAAGSAVTVGNTATLGGTGTINDNITVQSGGTLSPGTSIGTLTANGDVTLQSGSTTAVEVNRSGPNTDLITGIATLTQDGTLQVSNLGTTLQSGDQFTLFSATTYTGEFVSISPANPNSDTELAWDAPALKNTGILKVHHVPYATNVTVVRAKGLPTKVKLSDLFPATDPVDSDAVVLDSFTAGGQSATITSNASYIFYTPANNNNDSLNYTVKDNRGGSRTRTITVVVTNAVGAVTITNLGGGTIGLTFHGIPGYEYRVQRSCSDLNSFADWGDLITAPSSGSNIGLVQTNDTPGVCNPAYYRIRQN